MNNLSQGLPRPHSARLGLGEGIISWDSQACSAGEVGAVQDGASGRPRKAVQMESCHLNGPSENACVCMGECTVSNTISNLLKTKEQSYATDTPESPFSGL